MNKKSVIFAFFILIMLVLKGNQLEFNFPEAETISIPYSYQEINYDKFYDDYVNFYDWSLEDHELTLSRFTLNNQYEFSSKENFITIEIPESIESLDDLHLYPQKLKNSYALLLTDVNRLSFSMEEQVNSQIEYLVLFNATGEFLEAINIKDYGANYVFRQRLTEDKLMIGEYMINNGLTDSYFENYIVDMATDNLTYWLNNIFAFKVLPIDNYFLVTADYYNFEYEYFFASRIYDSNFNLVNEIAEYDDELEQIMYFCSYQQSLTINDRELWKIEPIVFNQNFCIADLTIQNSELSVRNISDAYNYIYCKLGSLSYLTTFLTMGSEIHSFLEKNDVDINNNYNKITVEIPYSAKALFSSSDYIVVSDYENEALHVYDSELNLKYSQYEFNWDIDETPFFTTWFDRFGFLSQDGSSFTYSTLNVSVPNINEGTNLLEIKTKNYPNPFNPETQIEFSISQKDRISLEVFNTRGQLVNMLAKDVFEAGTHRVKWNGTNLSGEKVSSGIYFYRLVSSYKTQTSKMILMK